jgi:hypothetical protein
MVRGSYRFVLGLGCCVLGAALDAHAEHRGQQQGRSANREVLSAMAVAAAESHPAATSVADIKTAVTDAIRRSGTYLDGQVPVESTAPKTVSGEPTDPFDPASPAAAELVIHEDYQKAMKEAAEDRKMLFIYFYDRTPNAASRAFETESLSQLEIKEKLRRYVVVKLPRDVQITVQGKKVELLKHPAFAEMLGRQGVAIIDLVHERSDYYGHVVSTFPFNPGRYYRKSALSTILDLPPGTLTQRTMIYAVRIHPERPASTQGQLHATLSDEARSHAIYQASIQIQGHHSWDQRFHRINAKLPGGVLAQEVVAESWPHENLVEACIDCVHSWRQSPGHWGAVFSRHPLFGYDIKRGRNGIWYATGIFGRR